MVSSIQNMSIISSDFVLVWLAEVDTLRYLYALIVLVLYGTTMFVSSVIVYVTWEDESLHEPMYIFICNLVLNVMFGSSSFYLKLFIDLLFRCSTVTLVGCLAQSFCIQSYVCVEIFTFTVMAYDRYLAVGHPLRYPTLMTNMNVLKVLLAIWVFVLVTMAVGMVLTARLTFCGVNIDNVCCESLSLQRLACSDIIINTIYGTFLTSIMMTGSLLVVFYSYLRTGFICLKLSREATQKATHTLVTHLVAFSTFIVSTIFVSFRYRFNFVSVSRGAQIAIAVTGMGISITLNPLIYGIRTKALRIKVRNCLQKESTN